jgi:DNA-directed RNA polymerase subunit H (RpoH/RPB5)
VFEEMFRALKPGGRFMVSDIVLLQELPTFMKNSVAAYAGCISGAIMKDTYLTLIKKTGFQKVKILDETCFPIELMLNDEEAQVLIRKTKIKKERLQKIGERVASIKVEGIKPQQR